MYQEKSRGHTQAMAIHSPSRGNLHGKETFLSNQTSLLAAPSPAGSNALALQQMKESEDSVRTDSGGQVIQLMPWHAFSTFPHEQLDIPAAPAALMTGYQFTGYEYTSGAVINAASQTEAAVAAAEFIARLPGKPKGLNMLTNDDIARYKGVQFTSANYPGATPQEKEGAKQAAIRNAAVATHEDFRNKLQGAPQAPQYAESFASPAGTLLSQKYDLYHAMLAEVHRGESAGDNLAQIIVNLQALPNYVQLLSNGQRHRIEHAAGYPEIKAAIRTAITAGQTLFKTKEYNARQPHLFHPVEGQALPSLNSALARTDPFHVCVRTTFPSGVNPPTPLNIYYQFSRESYGYVTRITRGADTYRMANAIAEDDLRPGEYSSTHNTADNNSLAVLGGRARAGGPGAETPQDIVQNGITFDAITKLAGEGGRWQCVRNHADILANDSRFYHVYGGNVYYITFENLWKSWRTFNNAYDIPDADVVDKLLHAPIPNPVPLPDHREFKNFSVALAAFAPQAKDIAL